MKIQKISRSQLFIGSTGRLLAAVAVSVLVVGSGLTRMVSADQYDQQIQALQSENAQAQSSVDALRAQASSYEDAIAKLQAQINAIQAEITANQAQQVALQTEITQKQAQIDSERKLLGDDIKAMYIDGNMSTVEMLATSQNLSQFVDKQEYRNAVQKNIQSSLAKIAALQNDLKIKKAQVDQLVENQKAQSAQMAADRQQQADMLAYTEAQKNAFSAQISANSSKIADLRRQQIIANSQYNIGPAGSGVNCGGGYPARWCEIPQDSVVDAWGMFNRECVSYTAFKVHQDFLAGRNSRDMPYWGNIPADAKNWDDNAIAAGIRVDSNPTPGSIAISNSGNWGHAMYVEAVGTRNGAPAVYISQYNAGYDGKYSEAWRYTTGLVFLHF